MGGPDHCPKGDFVCEISINDIWMYISEGLVPRSRFLVTQIVIATQNPLLRPSSTKDKCGRLLWFSSSNVNWST